MNEKAPATLRARVKRLRLRRAAVVVTSTMALLLVSLAWHRVDNSLTVDDRDYIPRYISTVELAPQAERSFAQEIEIIRGVQHAVLAVAPTHAGVPRNAPREPRDLYESRAGLCYDRSRVIEKILRYVGFETRHVSLYSTKTTGSALKSLLTRATPSHAISEVLTKEGWLVVDSNDPWLSLSAAGFPIDIRTIAAAAHQAAALQWHEPSPIPTYEEPFVAVYGLYSRHGRFYTPYNFVPDIHYGEFAHNLMWFTMPRPELTRVSRRLAEDIE